MRPSLPTRTVLRRHVSPSRVTNWRVAFRSDYERVGPDIRGNRLLDNSINGLFVRTETPAGNDLQTLQVQARFDDTDIVHVLGENLIIAGTPGGSFLETTAPDVSLVVLNDRVGSLPAGDQYDYKVVFVDIDGGVSIPSVPTALATATSGGVRLSNLASGHGRFCRHGGFTAAVLVAVERTRWSRNWTATQPPFPTSARIVDRRWPIQRPRVSSGHVSMRVWPSIRV